MHVNLLHRLGRCCTVKINDKYILVIKKIFSKALAYHAERKEHHHAHILVEPSCCCEFSERERETLIRCQVDDKHAVRFVWSMLASMGDSQ